MALGGQTVKDLFFVHGKLTTLSLCIGTDMDKNVAKKWGFGPSAWRQPPMSPQSWTDP
jgi:hypothetical protein